MKKHEDGVVLLVAKDKKSGKVKKFRDTVLVRVDRDLKNEVKAYSKRSKETISKIMDWAVKDYLKSVRPLV